MIVNSFMSMQETDYHRLTGNGLRRLRKTLFLALTLSPFILFTNSCDETIEHTAPAIHDRDSVSRMTT